MLHYTSVKSSMIDKIGYEEPTKTLHVIFGNGSHYSYADVPKSLYFSLLNSNSKGSFLFSQIKGKYVTTKHAETE